jgi:hypothetical protein
VNFVFHDEYSMSHGRKVTTGQKALRQRILQTRMVKILVVPAAPRMNLLVANS